MVSLDKPVESAVEDAARLSSEIHAPAGVTTQITGVPQLYHEFNQKIEHDLVQAEMISLPIALLILLAVFGTLVAAGLPLLIAGLALPTAFAVIRLLAGVVDMSVFVNNLASMIGLALAIDYSLFLVSRFREELRHHSVEIAIERMMGSVGKAVAISGVAVAIGLSSLTVFQAAALRSMGIAGIVTVLSTLLFGLTVLPAILGMLGPRVNRLRVPLPAPLHPPRGRPGCSPRPATATASGAGSPARVMRRPFLIAIPVLALLLARRLAVPLALPVHRPEPRGPARHAGPRGVHGHRQRLPGRRERPGDHRRHLARDEPRRLAGRAAAGRAGAPTSTGSRRSAACRRSSRP